MTSDRKLHWKFNIKKITLSIFFLHFLLCNRCVLYISADADNICTETDLYIICNWPKLGRALEKNTKNVEKYKPFPCYSMFTLTTPPPPASLCTSVSPYHEVMRLEKRLRSSSEGAGGPRIHGNHRDAAGMDGCGLLKHRNNSSSSKMGSLVGAELVLFVVVCLWIWIFFCSSFSKF